MRGLFPFVLLLIVALLVAVGFYVLHPEWLPRGTPATSSDAGGPSKASDQAGQHPQRKPPGKRLASREAIIPDAPGHTYPQRADTPPRFPQAPELVAGTPKSAILATFGPPAAVVTGSNLGQLQERFVYLDKASGTKTHVFFLNGRVTRANTSGE